MKKLKIMTVFGTRPEAIKMCPLVLELDKHDNIESVVCLTGQHRQMLDQVIDIFKIVVDYVPVLVMRTETERPEAVSAGTVQIVGVDETAIYDSIVEMLTNAKALKFFERGYLM